MPGSATSKLPTASNTAGEAQSFESLSLTAVKARQVALLPWRHRDPFDRVLVAEARVEGLILLTADDPLTAYSHFVRLVR